MKPAPSLARTLAVASFVLCALALLLAGGLQLFFSIQTHRALVSAQQRLIAQEAARTVSQFIQDRLNALEAATRLADPDRAAAADQERMLAGLLGLQSAFRQLALLNDEDVLTASASRLPKTALRSLAEGLSPAARADVRRQQRHVSEVYMDAVTFEPLVTLAVPVRDVFGDWKGTLAAEVNLKFMWDVVDQLKVGQSGWAYVVDRRGTIIAAGDTARVLRSESRAHVPMIAEFIRNPTAGRDVGTHTHRGLTGTMVLGSYVPLGTPTWAVVTELPWVEAHRQILGEVIVSLSIILAMSVVAGLVGASVSRRLTAHLSDLTKTAVQIASGHRELQAAVGGPREVAHLAVAFNSMTAQLRQSLEALEAQVAEVRRTQDALRVGEERLRLALEGASDGIWDWSLDTGELHFNPRWYTMLGYEPDEFPASHENWRRLLHPEDVERTDRLVRKATDTGTAFVAEFRLKGKNGQWRWILSRGKVVESDATGKSVRLAGSHADITERKLAEQQIQKLNAELEERVEQRTKQLAAANKELEAFAYSVSHDLRAPLRAIGGFTRILVEDYAGALDAEGRSVCDVILGNTQRMGQLIDYLLAFSRLGRTELHSCAVDMEALVSSLLLELKADQDGKAVDLQAGPLPPAEGDPNLLRQVWANLLSNALKFSRKQDAARVEVGAETREQEIEYWVRDNGVGFDMAYVGKLFRVFERLHRREEFEGTGVGLAIVQRIVHRHGGRVWAEAAVDRGATFHFTLPRKGTTS